MNHRFHFVFVQRPFEARKIFDVPLHEGNLPIIAGTIEPGLRIGVADERNDARTRGDQILHQPKTNHAGCACDEDPTIPPEFI